MGAGPADAAPPAPPAPSASAGRRRRADRQCRDTDRHRHRDPQQRRDAAQAQGRHLSQRRGATSANSSLGITFNDATTFTAEGQRQVTIDNYVYEDGGKNNSGIFDIAKGTVAFAAAAVAKTGNMQITTPTARSAFAAPPASSRCRKAALPPRPHKQHQALSRCRRPGRADRGQRPAGRRLGALTQGASGFAIRAAAPVARASPPCRSRSRRSRRSATRASCARFMRRRTVGRQIVSQQREFRRANPQYRNPARPGSSPDNKTVQVGSNRVRRPTVRANPARRTIVRASRNKARRTGRANRRPAIRSSRPA